MKTGLVITILSFSMVGCAFFRWKPAQRVYTDLHLLRLDVERLPGVVPGVNSLFPMAPAVRLGLDELYRLDQLGVGMVELYPSLYSYKYMFSEWKSVLEDDDDSPAKPDSASHQPKPTAIPGNQNTGATK